MTSPYHPGEVAVQNQAGVRQVALMLENGINSIIQPAAKAFLQHQSLAIVATVDPDGRLWASLLTGKPGFLQVLANQTVKISAAIFSGDLYQNLRSQPEIGLLAIDLATRRRLRANGKAKLQPDNSIYLQTKQVYFNCPKYIQQRHLEAEFNQLPAATLQISRSLSHKQQQWIAQTDTFFIASFHPESGADASHRGGYPGFVKVVNASQLVFPDYAGNNMFNTLGNISLNPQTGLLFVDFERGSTLQLTGKANIIWDVERAAEFAGAERLIEFYVEQAREIINATALRWQFDEYSAFNPGSTNKRDRI